MTSGDGPNGWRPATCGDERPDRAGPAARHAPLPAHIDGPKADVGGFAMDADPLHPVPGQIMSAVACVGKRTRPAGFGWNRRDVRPAACAMVTGWPVEKLAGGEAGRRDG